MSPNQLTNCVAKMAKVSSRHAEDFKFDMHQANELAMRAHELRSSAWRLYRAVLDLPEPKPIKKKPKRGAT